MQIGNPNAEGLQYKAYADDSIFGRMKEIEIRGNPDEGIVVHKDRYVKFAGKWVEKLKWLGMEYDGRTDTLRAHTRNGSRLELPATMKDDLITADLMLKEDVEATELEIDWKNLPPASKPENFYLSFFKAERIAYHDSLRHFEKIRASEGLAHEGLMSKSIGYEGLNSQTFQ